jgi:hypothetical protein
MQRKIDEAGGAGRIARSPRLPPKDIEPFLAAVDIIIRG